VKLAGGPPHRDVVGLRITLSRASNAVVKDLLSNAWRRKAPKSLATK